MRQSALPTLVWDLPTRLFHWALVVLLVISWLSESLGWMQIHFLSGYTTLAALLFRLVWGCIGSESARFRHFLKGPRSILRHLAGLARREPDTARGHNAAGGWMVIVLLLLLAVQVGTGLCANDEVDVEGPLAHIVGADASNWLSHIHSVNFTLIQIAVALHVIAIVVYRVLKGQNLLTPMITGRKQFTEPLTAVRIAPPLLALAVFAVAAIVVTCGVRWLGG